MAFEKLEKKVNEISKKIKQGRLSQEIGDEISSVALENASEMVRFADLKKEEIKKNHI